MNLDLYRLHCTLLVFSFLGAFAVLCFDLQLTSTPRAMLYGGALVALYIPIMLLHFFAARGVRQVRAYGIVLSRTVAVLWIIQFPVGTILGAYVLWKGRNWRGEANVGTNLAAA